MEHNKFTVGTPVTYNDYDQNKMKIVPVSGHVIQSEGDQIVVKCRHMGTTYFAPSSSVSVDYTLIDSMNIDDVLYFMKSRSFASDELEQIQEALSSDENPGDVSVQTKTDTVKEVALRHGLPVTEVKLSCTEPEDLAGLPVNSVPHQPRDYSKLMNPKQHNKPLELTSHEYTRVWVKRTGDNVVTHMTAVGDVTEVTREIMGDDGETYTVSIKVEVKRKAL